MNPNPIIITRSFSDLHEFESSEVKWNLPLQKISIGNFHGSVNSVNLKDVLMAEGRFSGTLLQNGFTPEGYTTFALPAIDSSGFWWHYRKVNPENLLVFPDSRKLKAISYDGFHVYTLSIQDDFLNCLIEKFEFTGIQEKLKGREKVIPIGKRYVYMLNSLLQTISLRSHLDQGKDFPKKLVKQLQYGITEMFLKLVHQSEESSNIPIQRERDRTVLKAIEYILAQDLQTLSIEEITVRTGIKKRSLEYAFKEYVNVGPKSFIKALRLNDFRQALMKEGKPITDTAYQHGFSHLGQLSRDYKLLFGELPSETLKKIKLKL